MFAPRNSKFPKLLIMLVIISLTYNPVSQALGSGAVSDALETLSQETGKDHRIAEHHHDFLQTSPISMDVSNGHHSSHTGDAEHCQPGSCVCHCSASCMVMIGSSKDGVSQHSNSNIPLEEFYLSQPPARLIRPPISA